MSRKNIKTINIKILNISLLYVTFGFIRTQARTKLTFRI